MEEDRSQNQEPESNHIPPEQHAQPASPAPPPQPRQEAKKPWFSPLAYGAGCLTSFILFIGLAFFVMLIVISSGGRETSRAHVALVRISGVITAGQSGGGMFSSTTVGSEDIVDELDRIRTSKKAKAVVIRINSPGGSPAGSEEVYNAIMRLRKAGKPVYVSMGDVAASGGYFIASASDKIYADASTLTGSIGVIFHSADLSELYKKIGYKPEVIKSGKFKDIGSDTRPLTSEERALLQGIINNTYEVFLNAVAKGRNIPINELKPIADGRIYTGDQALKIKLIDKVADFSTTIKDAAKAGGLKGEPEVIEYKRKGFLDTILGSDAEEASAHVKEAAARKLFEEMIKREDSYKGFR